MERKFPFSEVEWIWMDGELVAFEEAKVHALSHGLHYGSGVFEGIRCYDTPEGSAVFRLDDHLRRLLDSARAIHMELAYGIREIREAILETLRANRLGASYIRPLAFRGFGSMRMDPRPCPVQLLIAAWPTRGTFMGEGTEEEGIDVCVSSWRRPPGDTMPVGAKATANYLNAQLITLEALAGGYTEGLALDPAGNVSEGAAMNLFLVRDGALWTPSLESSILAGITRDSVFALARDLGIPLVERTIPRNLLYSADEMFLSGTSAEIAPVRSVDRVPLGEGRPGPVTRRLSQRLMAVARGKAEDRHGWLTPVVAARESAPAG